MVDPINPPKPLIMLFIDSNVALFWLVLKSRIRDWTAINDPPINNPVVKFVKKIHEMLLVIPAAIIVKGVNNRANLVQVIIVFRPILSANTPPNRWLIAQANPREKASNPISNHVLETDKVTYGNKGQPAPQVIVNRKLAI